MKPSLTIEEVTSFFNLGKFKIQQRSLLETGLGIFGYVPERFRLDEKNAELRKELSEPVKLKVVGGFSREVISQEEYRDFRSWVNLTIGLTEGSGNENVRRDSIELLSREIKYAGYWTSLSGDDGKNDIIQGRLMEGRGRIKGSNAYTY